jgi:hypothetical protein
MRIRIRNPALVVNDGFFSRLEKDRGRGGGGGWLVSRSCWLVKYCTVNSSHQPGTWETLHEYPILVTIIYFCPLYAVF